MKTWAARFAVATIVTLLSVGSHYWLAAAFELGAPVIDWPVVAIMWLVLVGAFTGINQLPADVLDR